MEFLPRFKGSITQCVVKTLLEDAGYKVSALGIEEVIQIIRHLEKSEYQAMSVPEALRVLPDIFVFDQQSKEFWLLEVKYRKNPDALKSMKSYIKKQAKVWKRFYLWLFFGELVAQKETPEVHMTVLNIELDEHENIVMHSTSKECVPLENVDWEDEWARYTAWENYHGVLWRVQDVFSKLGDEGPHSQETLKKASIIMKGLYSLSK